MAAIIIPIHESFKTSGKTSQSTVLDGETYYIDLTWNDRTEKITITIRDINLDVVIAGNTLRPSSSLLSLAKSSTRPKGDLTLWDSSGLETYPTLASMGVQHFLLYYPVS